MHSCRSVDQERAVAYKYVCSTGQHRGIKGLEVPPRTLFRTVLGVPSTTWFLYFAKLRCVRRQHLLCFSRSVHTDLKRSTDAAYHTSERSKVKATIHRKTAETELCMRQSAAQQTNYTKALQDASFRRCMHMLCITTLTAPYSKNHLSHFKLPPLLKPA